MTYIVVPSTDPAYPIYAQIVANKATITANKNPQLTNRLRQDLPGLEAQLVRELMISGKVTPDSVLSACTYAAGDTNTY